MKQLLIFVQYFYFRGSLALACSSLVKCFSQLLPVLSMALLESCFPYDLLNSYHLLHRGTVPELKEKEARATTKVDKRPQSVIQEEMSEKNLRFFRS